MKDFRTIGRRPSDLSEDVIIFRTKKDDRKEQCLQIECAGWLKEHCPDLLWWHTRQEGNNSKGWHATGAKCGVKKGVPDIIICSTKMGFFELKTKSTPSEHQKAFLSKSTESGHFACLVYSFEDFKVAVKYFLKNYCHH